MPERRHGHIQGLWGGYGEVFRATQAGRPVVVKQVRPPSEAAHPRGWDTDAGHARKLRSYAVELAFYRDWAPRLGPDARVARCWEASREGSCFRFVLEDLDAAGFPERRSAGSRADAKACLRWLAHFHATFLGETPTGLWPVGTYWHLETRQEEWAALEDAAVSEAAPLWDAQLRQARFQTVVHGDAKLANFCFGPDGQVAAVDFQYVGGGPGVKDVIYLLSSLEDTEDMAAHAEEDLEYYLSVLHAALEGRDVDRAALAEETRRLYPIAWADFHRFLSGWAPEHWKLHPYCQRMSDLALEGLRSSPP